MNEIQPSSAKRSRTQLSTLRPLPPAHDVTSNPPRSFTATYSLGKYKVKARFIQDECGLYPCLCGLGVRDRRAADEHLSSLSEEELKESHPKTLWDKRAKQKISGD